MLVCRFYGTESCGCPRSATLRGSPCRRSCNSCCLLFGSRWIPPCLSIMSVLCNGTTKASPLATYRSVYSPERIRWASIVVVFARVYSHCTGCPQDVSIIENGFSQLSLFRKCPLKSWTKTETFCQFFLKTLPSLPMTLFLCTPNWNRVPGKRSIFRQIIAASA